jgi:hypothetical protein
MRKLRASMTALTRPSPCGSKLQGAAIAESAAAATSNTEHTGITARPVTRNGIVTGIAFMTQPIAGRMISPIAHSAGRNKLRHARWRSAGCSLPLGVGCGMIASTMKTPRNNDAA